MMEKIKAVIEGASIHDVFDIFPRKPPGLKFNETDVVIVRARMPDGKQVSRSFYFCLKPDGTFEETPISNDASRYRRHKLSSFIKYYGIAGDLKKYNIRDKVREWKGRAIEVVPYEKKGFIYVP
jgi:hypothetical protein